MTRSQAAEMDCPGPTGQCFDVLYGEGMGEAMESDGMEMVVREPV